jgi:hypothetical protein
MVKTNINNEPSEFRPASTTTSLRDFFTLWLNNLEKFMDERWCRIDEKFKDFEMLLEERWKRVDDKFDAVEEAGMNEFRNTLRDQNNTFFTKDAHVVYMEKVQEQIRPLQDFKLILDSKATTKQVIWAYVLSGASILLGIIAIITKIIVK